MTNGHLLDLGLLRDGVALTDSLWLEVQPLEDHLPGEWWYSLDWEDATHRYRAMLPYDVYYVTAHDPPAGSYDTTQAFDLRSADRTVAMPLSSTFVHPIPTDFPGRHMVLTVVAEDGPGQALSL